MTIMCDKPRAGFEIGHFDRRKFLRASTTATAAALLGATLEAGPAGAQALTQQERDQLTPEEILAEAKRGNDRFRTGQRASRDFLAEQKATAMGQYPAAVVLSCMDSRVSAEVIMDLSIGDTFNCRVAGNVENDDILGSMEYACKVAGAKVVLVMGHTSCGAVKGAIDNVQLDNLTSLLAKIRPAALATPFSGDRSSKNPAFVDAVARKNVELTIAQIRERSAVLRALESARTIKIAGAMYDVETATIDFFS
jgi:carbonic anhydrase